MDTTAIILAAWSTAIYAVIRVIQSTEIGECAWWARLVPLAPLILGGLSGPAIVPIIAGPLPWLAEAGVLSHVVIGIGAGAVAASGHSTKKQTIGGLDARIYRAGRGAKQ